jgi:ketosteroid isomerase-like protein
MRSRLLQTTLVVLSMFLSVSIVSLNANGQTAGALPSDVIAANRELDHQLLEGHRLLDAEKVMGLFTSSPDIFFIAPDGELYKGPDQVRQAWVRFFASLQSIHGEINHISYLREGDGVIAVGQVTYYRQLKDGKAQQRVVVWTDFRHKENGKWVYVFRHAHWPLEANPQTGAAPSARGPTAEQIHVSPSAHAQFVGTWADRRLLRKVLRSCQIAPSGYASRIRVHAACCRATPHSERYGKRRRNGVYGDTLF